ncbi:hypothetical protein AO372_1128 [Moraxella catarrhalis]|nr:hypothetical protein AO372_1128 [Moraxella catarrhalis]
MRKIYLNWLSNDKKNPSTDLVLGFFMMMRYYVKILLYLKVFK